MRGEVKLGWRIIISASTGEARFHAKKSKESVAKSTSFFEQREAFKGRILTNIYHGDHF